MSEEEQEKLRDAIAGVTFVVPVYTYCVCWKANTVCVIRRHWGGKPFKILPQQLDQGAQTVGSSVLPSVQLLLAVSEFVCACVCLCLCLCSWQYSGKGCYSVYGTLVR